MTATTTVAKRARTLQQFCTDYGVGRTFTYAEIKAGRLRAVKAGDPRRNAIFVSPLYSGIRHDRHTKRPRASRDVGEVLRA